MSASLLGYVHKRFAICHIHGSRNFQCYILARTHGGYSHAHVPFPRSANPNQIYIRMCGSIAPVGIDVAYH